MIPSIDRIKPLKVVLALRVYTLVTGCAAYGSVAGGFVFGFRRGDAHFMQWLAAGVFFMAPFVFMMFNLAAFPWRYSVLGRFRRTAAPTVPARFTVKDSRVVVGNMSSPFVTWVVYDSGIELRIGLCGKAFIPREAVVRLEPYRRRWCRLEHRWEEIKNPILMPKQVAAEFAKICPPQCVML